MADSTLNDGQRMTFSGLSLPARCFVVVIAAYLVIFSGILIWSGGLPYVLDGNENFSNLIHARNWVEFGTQVTHGLADESYGRTLASHPFIHTHQGNMPRLTGTLLYAMGIESPEVHIWLHVLVIGPLIMAAIYAFASSIGGAWFATCTCFVLMFDYVFFIQWQVNTYRMWAMFFVAGGLALVEYVHDRNIKYFSVLFFVLFALLFYGELVFAAFCAALLGIYTILRHHQRWRLLVVSGASMFAGAATGLSILFLQLLAFYGPDNLVKDFTYTFLTRNATADFQSISSAVAEFFQKMPIVFFYNAQDQSVLRTLNHFIESILSFQASVYHPLIFLLAAIIGLFCLAGLLSSRIRGSGQKSAAFNLAVSWFLWVLVLCSLAFELILNEGLSPYIFIPAPSSYQWAQLAVFLFACSVAVVQVRFRPVALLLSQEGIKKRLLLSASFGAVATALISMTDDHIGGVFAGFWQIHGGPFVKIGLGLAGWVMIWMLMVVLLFPRAREFLPKVNAMSLLKFGIASMLAYGLVFLASSGYVFSGYLYRGQTPLVLQWATFFGLALAALSHVAWQAFRGMVDVRRLEGRAVVLRSLADVQRNVFAVASLGLVLLVCAWGIHQVNYALALPPDQFRFVQTHLRQPGMHGTTSVSNTYAAPFAYEMENWSYADYRVGAGRVVWNGKMWEPQSRSLDYLWVADRHGNENYLWPEYFICFIPTGLREESHRLRKHAVPDCFDMPLVQQALKGEDPGIELVASAERTPRRWAILRFNWYKPRQ